jgi:Uma2 family endonuclease
MTRARTVEDLYRFEGDGQVELVGGELIQLPLQGDLPNRAAGAIYVRLRHYESLAAAGRAYTGSAVYLVSLPGRGSFSPDVGFYDGPRFGGKFLEGAPILAVEARNEEDYGPRAESEMAAKRADYFAAGTQVVWDVDVLRGELIRAFRANDPENPVGFGRGEIADAEPALPGFRMPIDDIFE